jgi:hypothetical protein
LTCFKIWYIIQYICQNKDIRQKVRNFRSIFIPSPISTYNHLKVTVKNQYYYTSVIIFYIKINSIVLLFFQAYVEKIILNWNLTCFKIWYIIQYIWQNKVIRQKVRNLRNIFIPSPILFFSYYTSVIIFYIKINSIVLLFFQAYVEKFTSPVSSFQLFYM